VSPWPPSVAFPLTLLASIALMLAFDAAAAWYVRDRGDFTYGKLWPLQFGLYVIIGFIAMFAVLDIRRVELIGAITGFLDATAGWAIAWRIGPGRRRNLDRGGVAVAVLAATAFGLGLTAAGALLFNAVAGALIRAHG
jgi:hypothetical protein